MSPIIPNGFLIGPGALEPFNFNLKGGEQVLINVFLTQQIPSVANSTCGEVYGEPSGDGS
jgi:hypothetical protein